jgi:hypothetical protein
MLAIVGSAWGADTPATAPGTVSKLPGKPAGPAANGGGVTGVTANTPKLAPVIKGMEISPAKAKSSETVTVKLNGAGTCKFHVDFGNGLSMDKEETLPTSFPASFIVATYETNIFTVTATGLAGCKGSAQASVTVGEPIPANTTTTLKIKVNPTLLSTTTTTYKVCAPGKQC